MEENKNNVNNQSENKSNNKVDKDLSYENNPDK